MAFYGKTKERRNEGPKDLVVCIDRRRSHKMSDSKLVSGMAKPFPIKGGV